MDNTTTWVAKTNANSGFLDRKELATKMKTFLDAPLPPTIHATISEHGFLGMQFDAIPKTVGDYLFEVGKILSAQKDSALREKGTELRIAVSSATDLTKSPGLLNEMDDQRLTPVVHDVLLLGSVYNLKKLLREIYPQSIVAHGANATSQHDKDGLTLKGIQDWELQLINMIADIIMNKKETFSSPANPT